MKAVYNRWQLLDPEGKLPKDVFAKINDNLNFEDDSGRVYSATAKNWFTWEVMNPDDTEPEDSQTES